MDPQKLQILSPEVTHVNEFFRNQEPMPFTPLSCGLADPVFEDEKAMRLFASLPEQERRRIREDLRGMSIREARSYEQALARRAMRQ